MEFRKYMTSKLNDYIQMIGFNWSVGTIAKKSRKLNNHVCSTELYLCKK